METALVTKEKMVRWILQDPIRTIGRALVAIYRNQLPQEQASKATIFRNGIGFTGSDARIGTLAAKYYMEHDTLEPWQIKIWIGLNKKGLPRITKYSEQLNQIANDKLSRNI